jgi:hypothetical protein
MESGVKPQSLRLSLIGVQVQTDNLKTGSRAELDLNLEYLSRDRYAQRSSCIIKDA